MTGWNAEICMCVYVFVMLLILYFDCLHEYCCQPQVSMPPRLR